MFSSSLISFINLFRDLLSHVKGHDQELDDCLGAALPPVTKFTY